MSSRKLIPRSAVEAMTRGSLEQTISRVRETVRTSKLFGESAGRPHLVATFPGYAIVGTDSGRFFRVKVQESSGQLDLSECQDYPVEVIDSSGMGKVVEQKIDDALTAALAGKGGLSAALHEAAELISMDAMSASQQAHQLVAALNDKTRPWRAAMESRRTHMRKFVESELPRIRARLPQQVSKFSPLYSGVVPSAQVEDFARVVKTDLSAYSVRLAKMAIDLGEGYSHFCEDQSKFRSPDEAAVIEGFRQFAEDFIEDVAALSEAARELSTTEGAVAEAGLACDTLASKLEELELASAFLEKTLRRAKDQ